MAVKMDTHIHTSFSTDSETDMQEQILTSYKKGLEGICITDHMDYNFPESALEHPVDGIPFCFDLNDYFKRIHTLQKTAPLSVYTGVECGMQLITDVVDKNKALCRDKEFDYIIGSLHLVDGKDPYYPSFWENQEPAECIQTYFEKIYDNITTFHEMDSLGHLDYIVRYAPTDYKYQPEQFREILEAILQTLIQKDLALEINTSGFKTPLSRQNPHEKIIEWYLALGGEMVTIGSDAHSPEFLAFHFDEVAVLLKKYGIRLDSGDLAYLSKKARKMLDEAGFPDASICASNDLDEYLLHDLKAQGAAINSWGVGTHLITSKDCPSFGGVYKLAAVEIDGEMIPKIKLSENPAKITNPGNKTVYRIYDKESGKIRADYITLADETFDDSEDLLLFDPNATWKKTRLEGGTYTMKEILVPIFKNGQCVYDSPSVMEIQKHCKEQLETMWEESRRLVNPQEVFVDLSDKLYEMKKELLNEVGR